MGRPRNCKCFGDPSESDERLSITMWDGNTAIPGKIVKQTGSRRYRVSDINNTITDNAKLVAYIPLSHGEMQITHEASGQAVLKISAHKVLLADGTVVKCSNLEMGNVSNPKVAENDLKDDKSIVEKIEVAEKNVKSETQPLSNKTSKAKSARTKKNTPTK